MYKRNLVFHTLGECSCQQDFHHRVNTCSRVSVGELRQINSTQAVEDYIKDLLMIIRLQNTDTSGVSLSFQKCMYLLLYLFPFYKLNSDARILFRLG